MARSHMDSAAAIACSKTRRSRSEFGTFSTGILLRRMAAAATRPDIRDTFTPRRTGSGTFPWDVNSEPVGSATAALASGLPSRWRGLTQADLLATRHEIVSRSFAGAHSH